MVSLAKKMSSQMYQMAEYARGRGQLQVLYNSSLAIINNLSYRLKQK